MGHAVYSLATVTAFACIVPPESIRTLTLTHFSP